MPSLIGTTSTAAALAAYHKELTESGLEPELVAALVRDAGHMLHSEQGLVWRDA